MKMIQIFFLASVVWFQVQAFVETPAEDLSIDQQQFELQQCEPIDKCQECTFTGNRGTRTCQKSGYVEKILCTYVNQNDKTNTYQEEHLRPCEANHPVIYSWEFIFGINVFLGLMIFYLLAQEEKEKLMMEQFQRLNNA